MRRGKEGEGRRYRMRLHGLENIIQVTIAAKITL